MFFSSLNGQVCLTRPPVTGFKVHCVGTEDERSTYSSISRSALGLGVRQIFVWWGSGTLIKIRCYFLFRCTDPFHSQVLPPTAPTITTCCSVFNNSRHSSIHPFKPIITITAPAEEGGLESRTDVYPDENNGTFLSSSAFPSTAFERVMAISRNIIEKGRPDIGTLSALDHYSARTHGFIK